jgi:OOP family OmpA-OmpF porin
MNSLNARQLSSIVAATVTALALVCGFATSVQAQPQSNTSAHADITGSVTEPLGEGYVAPSKLNPKLARVTLYRPSQGFAPGVAQLEINGHYHTSLQRGGFTEICVEPASFELAAQMVFIDGEFKNVQDIIATLKPEAAQNLFLRVITDGDSRATLTPVSANIALAELKNTRRQIHAASRYSQAKDCIQSAPSAKQENAVKETIVLSAYALFEFDKSDIPSISAKGRYSLDEVMARLQKEYGSDAVIQITGHADPLGNPDANKRLSKARALAIRNYFIQGGMSAERITGDGVGAEQPVIATCGKTATPKSIECNQPNRRVVVSVQATAH